MFSLGSMLLEGGGTSVFTTFQSRNCKVLHTLPSGGLGGGGGLEACSPRKVLRWLTKVFYGLYLPSLSINCVAINKDLEK